MPARPSTPSLRRLPLLLALCAALGGCATADGPPGAVGDSEAASELADSPESEESSELADSPESEESSSLADSDPLEPMNRAFFAFNETLDRWVLAPVATAWDFVLPDFAMTAIDDFFKHLNMPIVLANDILQGKPIAAIEDLARITHNTVFGLGGFYDIATKLGIPENDEDFGQTLGYYGVPPGPFLMMPILGPYTLRDGIGDIVDTTATGYLYSPIWTSAETLNLNTGELWAVSIGQKGVQLLNLRAIYAEELEESRRDAFDYYVFVRNAYLQSRRAKVADQTDAPVIDEDELYFFDEEEDEEDYDDF